MRRKGAGMTVYTIRVIHDDDRIDVEIIDLDPANLEKEKPAILAALRKAVQTVEKANHPHIFQ